MKICHFEINDEDKSLLAELAAGQAELSGGEIATFPEILEKDNAALAADAEIISVFVNSAINRELIDMLPKLKLIVTRSAGFDHIDCQYAASKNIIVSYIPAYGSRTVAEYTYALMLGLARKAFQANYHIKVGQDFDYHNFEGTSLQGKTLGVIGTGRIGTEVIKIARGFEMKVVAFDVFPDTAKAKDLQFQYLTLNDLLSQSDIVTLHVPYNPQTHHLINDKNVSHLKKGALLINTSRGAVIDTTALLAALEEKLLSGVALDVLEDEHDLQDEMELLTAGGSHQEQIKVLLENHLLMDRPDVVITPHIAFYSKEAEREIIQQTLGNIVQFLKGQPQNLVKL